MHFYKRLPLLNMSNCRDLGGYPSKFGGTTKFGVFLRSEAPVELSQNEIAFLKEYGVTRSLDFRGDEDVSSFPSSLNCDGIEYLRIPMFGRADAMGFDLDADNFNQTFSGWGKSYITWIETFKGWVRDVFSALCNSDGACHFNCNAGKDRTGIISALVLSVCGVELCDIAFDYCVSRSMLKPRFDKLARQWGSYMKDEEGNLISNHPFLYTPRSAMYQLFKYIYSSYGTVENYLKSCGVTDAQIFEIRSKLLDN